MNPKLASHPVVRDFMWLSKYTSPYGWEHERFGDFFTSKGFELDPHGNLVLDVGKSKTIFAAHLDTADRTLTRVRRQVKGDIISTDGKSILGADDRAGLAVLLHLLRHNVPGRYLLFVGEEIGRFGSTGAEKDGLGDGYDRIVCWDRMGDDSIITHQMGRLSCSPEFANALVDVYETIDPSLRLSKDPGGSYTDSYSFIDCIPECTNISVGYNCQHTVYEEQDARFLVHMAEASAEVPWEHLPTERDPHATVEPPYRWDWHDDDLEDTSRFRYSKRYDSNYLIFDDLVTARDWDMLTLDNVKEYIAANPQDAAETLYALLEEGVV